MNAYKKLILLVAFLYFLLAPVHNVSALTLSPDRTEVDGLPGETLYGKVILLNETKEEVTYFSSTANFEAQGETGTPSFDLNAPKEDLASWIVAPEKVTLLGGESQTVPYSIVIPEGVEPGGYFAALFWNTSPPGVEESGVSIGASLGSLVLLSVRGNVKEGGGILEYRLDDEGRSFYTALPVSFLYRFQNTGADRVKPKGTVEIKNVLGFTSATIDANPNNGNVLPRNSTRKFKLTWAKKEKDATVQSEIKGFLNKARYESRNFAFGPYKANLSIEYGTKNQKAEGVVKFFVFPWHFLLLLVVCLILIIFIFTKFIRSYNRYVIRQAEKLLMRERRIRSKEEDEENWPKKRVHKKV